MVAISLSRSGEELDGKPPGLQCYCATAEREEPWFQGTLLDDNSSVPFDNSLAGLSVVSIGAPEIAILVHSRLITRMHQGRRIQFFNNGWSGTTLPQRRRTRSSIGHAVNPPVSLNHTERCPLRAPPGSALPCGSAGRRGFGLTPSAVRRMLTSSIASSRAS